MSVIKIKRSGVAGSPSSLGQGELAYSYLSGNESNGGDRLYIGTGTETGSNAANIEVIGGKYFTEKLDHTPGTLTANSAIIVDVNSKIDNLYIDDIQINGNAITTTVTNRDIVISPNGTGSINVDNSKIINLAEPTANTDAATKAYVDSQLGVVSSSFTIVGDTGSDLFSTGQTLTFTGGSGIVTTVSNNSITFDLDSTANVTFNSGDFQGDLVVEGNLIVNGNTVTTNVTQLNIEDNIIHIASNNSADTVDFGWVGHYVNGGSNHAGMFRDSTDGEFYIFDAYTKDEIAGTTIDRLDASFSLARVNADTFIGSLEGNADTA